MPNENQGSVLLNSGYKVLGQILAGEGKIKFVRAALDGGDIPEGVSIEGLTAPVDFERDGLIINTENTGNGEATVVVQTSSIGVEVGFNVKGVMLFVEDPANGGAEVAYSYLPLQSDPVWIQPEGEAVNKLATFEIVNVVSAASSVEARISPEGLARAVDLADLAEKIALDIEALRAEIVAGVVSASLTTNDGEAITTRDGLEIRAYKKINSESERAYTDRSVSAAVSVMERTLETDYISVR